MVFTMPDVSATVGQLGSFFTSPGDRVVARGPDAYAVISIPQLVELTPAGHTVRFTWSEAKGATGARVDWAGLRIGAIAVQRPMGELKAEKSGNEYVVKIGRASCRERV